MCGTPMAAAIGVPHMIAKMRIPTRTDYGCIWIFRRARCVRSGVVKEFAKTTGKFCEIFRRYGAGFEHYKTAVMQQIAHGVAEVIGD